MRFTVEQQTQGLMRTRSFAQVAGIVLCCLTGVLPLWAFDAAASLDKSRWGAVLGGIVVVMAFLVSLVLAIVFMACTEQVVVQHYLKLRPGTRKPNVRVNVDGAGLHIDGHPSIEWAHLRYRGPVCGDDFEDNDIWIYRLGLPDLRLEPGPDTTSLADLLAQQQRHKSRYADRVAAALEGAFTRGAK
ncbi:hypothetical protein OOT46_09000 [Aquabacterium sp. A7-Y]|uniref:hypothetical protein n=1 Tax=Aquabacterium sp. A7-Y TaxID=1349605 RepID=UPI00223D9BCF|nr:hypothetical protein [Aquabacterium sp. A7-Y]MCW7537985.1 hypothetical protein [Aquabacterium sp. A7-Y]